jgi:hypothetical protein
MQNKLQVDLSQGRIVHAPSPSTIRVIRRKAKKIISVYVTKLGEIQRLKAAAAQHGWQRIRII